MALKDNLSFPPEIAAEQEVKLKCARVRTITEVVSATLARHVFGSCSRQPRGAVRACVDLCGSPIWEI